jgi:hypothetical protein
MDIADTAADVERFAAGFEMAMAICAGLLVVGAALAVVLLRAPAPAPRPIQPDEETVDVAKCVHCGVTGPQLHPRVSAGDRA